MSQHSGAPRGSRTLNLRSRNPARIQLRFRCVVALCGVEPHRRASETQDVIRTQGEDWWTRKESNLHFLVAGQMCCRYHYAPVENARGIEPRYVALQATA